MQGNFLITILSRFFGKGHSDAAKANKDLQDSTSGFSMAMAKLGSIMAAFWGGWRLGDKISEVTGLRKVLDDLLVPTKLVYNSIADLVKQRVSGLTDSFSASRKELEKMGEASDRVVASLGALGRAYDAGTNLETANKIASLQRTMAPGPAREEAIARVKAEAEVEASKNTQSVAQSTANERRAQADRVAAEIATAKDQLHSAQDKAAHYADLSKGPSAQPDDIATAKLAQAEADTLAKHIAELETAQSKAKTELTAAEADLLKAMERRQSAETALALQGEAEITRAQTDQDRIAAARDDVAKLTESTAQQLARLNADLQKPVPPTPAAPAAIPAAPQTATPEPAAPAAIPAAAQTAAPQGIPATTPAEPPATLTPDEKVAWYAKQKQAIELRRKLQDETRDQALQQDRARAAQAQETAGTLAAQARQQEQFADQAAASAAKARERVLNPAIARQEQQAARQKEREDERLSRLAARARAAGYTLDQAPGGEFSATKTGNIGPSSKRLAEALVAEAKAKFADQQKKDRDQLAIDAARAAVESQKLLKSIEANTKAGPIA